eukprot:scaffold6420_cov168-Amphora_coffeaeformis.AAC.10
MLYRTSSGYLFVVLLASTHSCNAFLQPGTTPCVSLRRDPSAGRLGATEIEGEETVLGSKYVLHHKGSTSTSGKSTLVDARPRSIQGGTQQPTPEEDAEAKRQRVIVKFSENIMALKREVENYEKVTTSDTKDLFVKVHDFYNPSENKPLSELPKSLANAPQFKGQAALVMERGAQDLKSYLQENGPLQGKALQDAVIKTARTVKACHDQKMVWTELKATNFVIQPNGDTNDIKAIDLESAVPQGGNPIDFSPEAIPPEFALAYMCGREPFMEMEPTFDIFSLGLLWYEMATGSNYWQHYFDEREPDQIKIANALRTTKDQMPVPASESVSTTIVAEVKELIEKCLKIDPQGRPSINDLMRLPYLTHVV